MAEELRHRLAEQEQEMLSVKNEIERVLSEIYRLEDRRKKLFLKMKELKAESMACKSRLNVLREEIRGLNEALSDLKREKDEKIAHLKEIRGKIKEYSKTRPKKREEDLEAEISSLDWRIQTSPLPLDEEKKIITRIKSLEEQLYFYRELKSMMNEAQATRNSIEEIRGRISACVNGIAERVSEKRRIQERLAETFRELCEVRAEIERVNEEYKRGREKISELRSKYKDLLNQVRTIKETIKYNEKRERAERISMLKEKIKKEASEKIGRGEKISFEEFKMLFEGETGTDNI
ncbi:MAG: hypothetical protein QXX56_04845 [Candidatus Bathyarchaeia archaeon]